MASSLVECGPCEDANWLYRPSVSETVGARYKEWLGWYLSERIACYARRVINFGGEFVLREGDPLRLLK